MDGERHTEDRTHTEFRALSAFRQPDTSSLQCYGVLGGEAHAIVANSKTVVETAPLLCESKEEDKKEFQGHQFPPVGLICKVCRAARVACALLPFTRRPAVLGLSLVLNGEAVPRSGSERQDAKELSLACCFRVVKGTMPLAHNTAGQSMFLAQSVMRHRALSRRLVFAVLCCP